MIDDHNGPEQTFRDTERNLRDRIEALTAENERLRETLMLCAKHVDWTPHPHCVEVETAIRAALGDKKMTNIEQKALELVNEVCRERGRPEWMEIERSNSTCEDALCRAIERHEAFRQEVSDAIVFALKVYGGHSGMFDPLRRFIIAKPDPLVEAIKDADDMVRVPDAPSYPEAIRAALAKRGGRIVFDD